MTTNAIDRRVGDFLDKWRQAFRNDAELQEENRKTKDFFADAKELREFLKAHDSKGGLSYATRMCAAIPGVSVGLKEIFAND